MKIKIKCSVQNCENIAKRKQMCQKHYYQSDKRQFCDTFVLKERKCTKCNIVKDLDNFNRRNNRGNGLSGYFSRCKQCEDIRRREYIQNNYEKMKKKWREYANKVKGPKRSFEEKKRRLRRQYNLDYDKYLEMEIKHQGKCKICNKKTKLHIDHNHKTGKVRGLLCINCNRALGFIYEDINILKSMIQYIEEDKCSVPKR